MKNSNAARILRNLVSSCLGADPKQVKLSGEMPLNYRICACSTSGTLYFDDQFLQVWGFSPHCGLTPVNLLYGEQMGMNADGTFSGGDYVTAEYLAREQSDSIFFVIHFTREYSDCNGRCDKEDTWTLFKSPDFTEKWKELEENDILRWEEYLS